MSKGSAWSASDDARLLHLRSGPDPMSWEDAAREMGRSISALRTRYSALQNGVAVTDETRKRRSSMNKVISEAPNARVSPQMIADREARYEASLRRSLTQVFFGDPAPGFSFLDKKRSVASVRQTETHNSEE